MNSAYTCMIWKRKIQSQSRKHIGPWPFKWRSRRMYLLKFNSNALQFLTWRTRNCKCLWLIDDKELRRAKNSYFSHSVYRQNHNNSASQTGGFSKFGPSVLSSLFLAKTLNFNLNTTYVFICTAFHISRVSVPGYQSKLINFCDKCQNPVAIFLSDAI